jgi:murein DD-endopeptidase MepM/ murein hydrolase activator NlpD
MIMPRKFNASLATTVAAIGLLAGTLTNASPAQAGEIFQRNSQDNGWNLIGGCARDIGVGANAQAWVIGCDKAAGGYGIYKRANNTWIKVPGGATHIAVRPNGLPVIVNEYDQIFTGNANETWNLLPGCARDIGVGANDQIWIVGCNAVPGGYTPYYWAGSDWQSVAGGITKISVKPNGAPVATNAYNEIFNWNGGWQGVGGRAKDISAGADGSLWVIGDNPVAGGYGIYKWAGSTWEPVAGGATKIAVNPQGKPWLVNNIGDSPTNLNNAWANPIRSSYYVSSEWGLRRLPVDCQYNGCYHTGIDLAPPTGSTPPVYAARSGRVTFAGWNSYGYGNLVKIDHGNGLETRYAHLSKISVKVGDSVISDTIIGNVGNTGISSGNHLHFEVRVDGQHKNPRNYIKF